MSERNKKNDNKKVIRKKRRVRNQIIAYGVVTIILIGLGIGGYIGVSRLSKEIDQLTEASAETTQEETESVTIPEENQIEIVEPETESEPVEYSKEELLEELVQSCIDEMPLEDKVAGLFVVTPESLTGTDKVIKAGDATKEALAKYPVGGLIYFKQNIQSEEQIKEMLANTKEYSKYPIFLAVDEELGEVARLQSALQLDKTKTAKELGEISDVQATKDEYGIIGNRLLEYGFNLDFAPVADILLDENNKAIGDRSFGQDTKIVSERVSASVEALNDCGVFSCLKHFPGQGAADGDTHEGIAATTRSADDIRANELQPFISGISVGTDMIMVGHFAAESLTGDSALPCSLSKEVMTDLLRGECQYDGVIITDALAMSAISDYYTSKEAAVKALKAGADMLLMPSDFEEAYNGVLEAVKEGTIDEQRIDDSLARVYRVKYASTIEDE